MRVSIVLCILALVLGCSFTTAHAQTTPSSGTIDSQWRVQLESPHLEMKLSDQYHFESGFVDQHAYASKDSRSKPNYIADGMVLGTFYNWSLTSKINGDMSSFLPPNSRMRPDRPSNLAIVRDYDGLLVRANQQDGTILFGLVKLW